MIEKPAHLANTVAESFQDETVAAAYRYRPPYPDGIFAMLSSFLTTAPRAILDVGCGTGDLARPLASIAERVDAVDFSRAMLAQGRQLPGGQAPTLRWIHGRIEEAPLSPPYALVIAGESLHWLDWGVALPRLKAAMAPGAYLALVERATTPDPWSILGEPIARHRTDGSWTPYAFLDTLAQHGLFRVVGEARTDPLPFPQPIDDYIESYHSRAGFSRERMAAATDFDREAREALRQAYPDGIVPLQVVGKVTWGIPL